MNVKLRTVKKEDVDILYEWANDPITRKNSFSEERIEYITHVNWFNSCMDNIAGRFSEFITSNIFEHLAEVD